MKANDYGALLTAINTMNQQLSTHINQISERLARVETKLDNHKEIREAAYEGRDRSRWNSKGLYLIGSGLFGTVIIKIIYDFLGR